MKTLAKIVILKPLYNLLIFFAAVIPGHSIGWGIILLTLVVRIVLYLPTRKSILAQRKLQELQPKMEALKQEYKDDQQGQAKAMMALYKDNGVSPFGACLPMLIQLPVLFILYYVFTISLNAERFDLLYAFTPRPEVFNTIFLGFDLAKADLWILPLVAGGLQFIASRQLMPQSKSVTPATDKIDVMGSFSKQMLYIFPLMTVVIARSLPAALAIYWITTTLFSIGQQWVLLRGRKQVTVNSEQQAGDTPTKALKSGGGIEVVVRKRKS